MKQAIKIHINQRGFSMIEMVIVLIVMAIMASYIMFRGTAGNDLIAQAEILKSHLRYAQIKAMNDTDVNVPGGWGIQLVRRQMDKIEYRRQAGENVLRLTKSITSASKSS